MLCYCCTALIKECCNGILSTPNCFFGIHHLDSICLILRLEDQELCRTIPYFSTFYHIFNIFYNDNVFLFIIVVWLLTAYVGRNSVSSIGQNQSLTSLLN